MNKKNTARHKKNNGADSGSLKVEEKLIPLVQLTLYWDRKTENLNLQ